MEKHLRFVALTVLISFAVLGCNSQIPLLTPTTETPIPTYTSTSSPTSTATPRPTHTVTPTATITPSPSSSCDADEVLRAIKADFPYDEFAVHYNNFADFDNIATLIVWYVDPEIDPEAGEAEIEQNAELAKQNAILASQQLVQQHACIKSLFDAINPIVVDENYNGWFSGRAEVEKFSSSENLSESELESIEAAFEIGYLRTELPAAIQAAPSDSCTWPETQQKIQNHFSPDRENVAFYFVKDEVGVNVWTQWDGPTDFRAMASILNVAMELDCLHPSPTQLIMVIVDSDGNVGLAGILPAEGIENLDINQMQIFYYQE